MVDRLFLSALRAPFLAALLTAVPWSDDARAADRHEPPRRIVSMNVCTDQLVMLLAERERIQSVSWLARNPEASTMADEAAAIPVNHGLAEEILPLRPDLVVAGAFTTRPTVYLLRRLGVPVLDMPFESSIEDIRSNVRRLAEALGRRQKGEEILARFDSELAAVPRRADPVRIALYWENGYTSGHGTLANALVEAAGLVNVAAAGLEGTAQLPIERLVHLKVELLILGRRADDPPALAGEVLRHPALRRAFADVPRVTMSGALWVCGTPSASIDLVTHLSQAAEAVRRSGSASRTVVFAGPTPSSMAP